MKKTVPNEKLKQLHGYIVNHDEGHLTTDQGVGVPNDQEAQKAGQRGPTLMQDFIFREKITHFDHERIPERIVHARGFAAHGHFRVYEDMSELTKAHFLSDPALATPVFVRFSTVAGFRGSPDTVRDVRGFAVKFYTQEGNYDIVGNNMPVFFIQDAIKFPDLIHALKPEPHNEIPQAQSAHDTFWDFVANNPESAHNVMWLMSDRAIPRSYRMMEGFGIHTFKFVNKHGDFKFVKFHWKPMLGVHSLVWDETQKIAGKDPDFNRRDLWEAIEHGDFPEWELGVQILDPAEEFKFDFDILDCTKLWPEELIPVRRIGKMTLDRNVTNYFAETEQSAFCPGNIVPGIDFSNDPMLQGRLFSYIDTQISRLGGPNFHEIPINRSVVKVNNNQRDGMHRMSIDEGMTSYYRNALGGGEPHPATAESGAYSPDPAPVEGVVTRDRSKSFLDYFSQASMFYNSMSAYEQAHIVDAFCFELGKCCHKEVRQEVVEMLNEIDGTLADVVARGVGAVPPKAKKSKCALSSPALSMAVTTKSAKTRKIAILAEAGCDKAQLDAVTRALAAAGARYDVVGCRLGLFETADGTAAECTQTFATAASVLYDAVYVPGGAKSVEKLKQNGDALHFVRETYKHYKAVGASGEGKDLLCAANLPVSEKDTCASLGIVTDEARAGLRVFADEFVAAVAECRFWGRGKCVETVSA